MTPEQLAQEPTPLMDALDDAVYDSLLAQLEAVFPVGRSLEQRLRVAVRRLDELVKYTEACEGLLNASPAGQVLLARSFLALMEADNAKKD